MGMGHVPEILKKTCNQPFMIMVKLLRFEYGHPSPPFNRLGL